ncbi:precorrin-6y C5,15-methyltransferase (decarboxylating) subunit CbiE [Propionispora hippei]|uniref:Precorrin-6Y C5,15-methyltransferase (Decarboxylating) n=1 Tax=Propionispora hippei DSM 15287 TaxID=1123003 RepID=A0A1M6A7W5_9FIRM|nr:precorrin-6y C5,15-methyltransferase (decarboxylating) subunit CbiE [Propionispora hippei]SHI32545.1 precorrin-6Y C5,15-methyltransferase (decarboxylating) [Propionispora hippei DSM 15287]
MEHKIIVAGIGPGSADYLLPVAKRTIEQARVLVGGKRALETLAPAGVKSKVIDGDIAGVLSYIEEELASHDVVVMVSGDPGFYSLLPAIRRRFPPACIEVIPGISSLQLAFARTSDYWQDATLISLHGRKADAAALAYRCDKKLGILTDSENNSRTIARYLLAAGWPAATPAVVCLALSYENEQVVTATLEELSSREGYSHCVMVVKA